MALNSAEYQHQYGTPKQQADLHDRLSVLIEEGIEESEARVIMAHGGPPFLHDPPLRQPVERRQPHRTRRAQR